MSDVVALLIIIFVAAPLGGAAVIWMIHRLVDAGVPTLLAVGLPYLAACAFGVGVTLLLGGDFS